MYVVTVAIVFVWLLPFNLRVQNLPLPCSAVMYPSFSKIAKALRTVCLLMQNFSAKLFSEGNLSPRFIFPSFISFFIYSDKIIYFGPSFLPKIPPPARCFLTNYTTCLYVYTSCFFIKSRYFSF